MAAPTGTLREVDPQTLHTLALAGMGLALALSVAALVASVITFNLSRAGKLRAFERVMADHATNATQRVETMETRMIEYRSAMDALVDQADDLLARSVKERKRVAQENLRAMQSAGADAADIRALPRAQQLEVVRGVFQGR